MSLNSEIVASIKIKTNLKEVDFLDVTFDLRKETYRPYKNKKMTNCSTSTHLQIIPGPSLSKFQHPSATDYLTIPQMKKISTMPQQNMKTRSKLLDTQQILNLTPRCVLCLEEKMAIITYPDQEKLLKKKELISKCRHENKFLLKYYDSND